MNGYCTNCGSTLPPAARFCPACGSTVTSFTSGGYQAPFGTPFASHLVRPIFGRQFAGVCAGLSRAYGWDVSLVRILFVITAIFLCPVPEILYLACWIGMPEETLIMTPPPPQA